MAQTFKIDGVAALDKARDTLSDLRRDQVRGGATYWRAAAAGWFAKASQCALFHSDQADMEYALQRGRKCLEMVAARRAENAAE